MEFFANAACTLPAVQIQRLIRIDTLPQWCASIERVLSHRGDRGDIYCVWGEFRVHREMIGDGLRFTLPGCPNALQWTITSDPDRVRIHCTINREGQDPDFVASIEQFVDDWRLGLEGYTNPDHCRVGRETPDCPPGFSGFG